MLHDLPPGFYGCLAGATVGAGLTIWTCWWLLARTRVGVRARLRAAARDEEGSAVVEFPWALLALVILTVMTCQFAFLTSAYVVVDYAAYCAARTAIVLLPQDHSKDDPKEGPNKIKGKELDSGTSGKGQTIHESAWLACYPIAGDYTAASAWDLNAVTAPFDSVFDVLGIDFGLDFGGATDFMQGVAARARYLTMLAYSRKNTEVEIEGSTGADDPITVRVSHWYSLEVPYADRMLRDRQQFPEGNQIEIVARATMMNEGQVGQKPPDPPSYKKPPD